LNRQRGNPRPQPPLTGQRLVHRRELLDERRRDHVPLRPCVQPLLEHLGRRRMKVHLPPAAEQAVLKHEIPTPAPQRLERPQIANHLRHAASIEAHVQLEVHQRRATEVDAEDVHGVRREAGRQRR